ncbi:hypothetical protein PV10_00246 [Exophiala mesophila]|uniref:Uncharacterized protein n=1 Tax=Exophiala mesophila TaxID=212818 RepID=A0A0D1X3H1_EXOME|nr:uncharacterized protein PV10_00246 [Exophiala mesophila]KIV96365.1 hypothetical protein PV10_00246 [Exophiala mesophila]
MPRGPVRRRNPNRYRHSPRIPSDSNARSHLERKLVATPIGQRPNDSDDSDRLVVKGNGRGSKRKQEIYASGAVRGNDRPGAFPTRAQRRKSLSNDTKEILAQAQIKALNAANVSDGTQQPTSSPQPLNATTSTLPSSSLKPRETASIPVQPTPIRDSSFLGALKPRRRQPSILQLVDHDSSSFDLDDEEQFLPDDESTPLNLSTAIRTTSTPATSSTQNSSSRKRKLGQSDVFLLNGDSSLHHSSKSPQLGMQHPSVTPGPSLPAVPASALRESGRKHQAHADHAEDIMAPPESSSSPSSSPLNSNPTPISVKRTKKAQDKLVPSMTTQELQAAVMPTKPRRTARDRKARTDKFDILADSDSPIHDPSDDSNFLPGRNTRRSERRNGRAAKSTRLQLKNGNGRSAKVGAKPVSSKKVAEPNHEQSTREFITTATSTVLSPSNARQGHETKSWSQLSSPSKDTRSYIGQGSRQGGAASEKQSGGSHPPTECETYENSPDKENLGADPWATNKLGKPGNHGTTVRGQSSHNKSRSSEVLKGKRPTKRDKWADIDAWDMDFEEVEVMTTSGDSSPTRR